MPNVYPYRSDDPDLRTCAGCESRVHVNAMCAQHPEVCMTCEGKAGGICPQRVSRATALEVSSRILLDAEAERENPAKDLYDYEAREEQ